MRITAIINQKGGVGKTTTAANLGSALARLGYKTLIIDLDPQANLTVSFALNPNQYPGSDAIFTKQNSMDSNLLKLDEDFYLLPAGKELRDIEDRLGGGGDPGYLLKNALEDIGDDFDYILIDCPPAANILTLNALIACDDVLCPVVGDFLALQGLSVLIGTLKKTSGLLQKLIPFNIVVTRFHPRRRLANEVFARLKTHFPSKILNVIIRETNALAECPGLGKTIFSHENNSKAAEDYRALANAYINKSHLASLVEGNFLVDDDQVRGTQYA